MATPTDQAIYTEDPAKRRVQAKVAEIGQRAQATAARPRLSAGLEVGSATEGEFREAQRRLRASTPRVAPAATPAAAPARLSAGLVESARAADLTPTERASFEAQRPGATARTGPIGQQLQSEIQGARAQTAARATPLPGAAPATPSPAAPAASPTPSPRVAAPQATATPRPATAPRAAKPGLGAGLAAATTLANAAVRTAGQDTQELRDQGFGGFANGIVDAVAASPTARLVAAGMDALRPGDSVVPPSQQFGDVARDLTTRTAGAVANLGRAGLDLVTLGNGDNVVDSARRVIGGGPFLQPTATQREDNAALGAGLATGALSGAAAAAAPQGEAAPRPQGYFIGSDGQRRTVRDDGSLTGTGANSLGTAEGGSLQTARGPVALGGGGFVADAGGGPNPGGTSRAAPSLSAGLIPTGAAPSGGDSLRAMQRDRDARLAELRDPTLPAGSALRNLQRDQTPTGKRLAAQFMQDYVGQGTAEFDARMRAQSGRDNDATQLQIAREGNAAATARGRAPQYITDDAGNITSLSDGIATPVTTADGTPARVTKGKAMTQRDIDNYVKTQLAIDDPQGLLTGEERRAKADEYLKQLRQGQ